MNGPDGGVASILIRVGAGALKRTAPEMVLRDGMLVDSRIARGARSVRRAAFPSREPATAPLAMP